jgi:hypothetical protein
MHYLEGDLEGNNAAAGGSLNVLDGAAIDCMRMAASLTRVASLAFSVVSNFGIVFI